MPVTISTLVVDDEPDMRLLIRSLVNAAGGDLRVVCEAASGREALDRLDECNPVVVVLDQMMPGLTGIETAALIRQRRPGLPLVLCSAYLTAELVREANEVGIDVCLSKDQIARVPQEVRRLAAA